ncbi:disease resistance protein RUN1-like [Macadamia integrifolia]|uniref:disease resistance protein RUN1-like n=1 Tax=Macadamia integrifolia TaxID=60698 RepID=UPI001C4EF99C|nr:disease resistance protein RUN1-like [Macadamia integrifolia]
MAAVVLHDGGSSSVSTTCYDVFLSCRPDETLYNFTAFLHKALEREGINVFMNGENLQKPDGGAIKTNGVLEAIQHSKISIPVFSKGYADSSWCLQELVEMVRCRRSDGQSILPIFLDFEPRDVRHQTGSYQQSFQRHQQKFDPQTVESWKNALTEVAQISGYHLQDVTENQVELIDIVVSKVLRQLDSGRLGHIKFPIGLDDRVSDLLLLLNVGSPDVRFVGICGIGGIGKTTIAKALYNHILNSFHRRCFLEDMGEKELVALQKQLLFSKNQFDYRIRNVHEGQYLIKERLNGENILLVLDNVTDRSQLDALAIESNWLGPGSRVIITSRDEHILELAQIDEDKRYWPKELDDEQSLQLFSWHAFACHQPPKDYKQFSHNVLQLARGLPLALEALCSSLSGRNKEEWEGMMLELKRRLDEKIYQNLKKSYYILDDDERSIFLDAACFFVGWRKEIVISLWEACGFYPMLAIKTLTQKSLLKFTANLSDSYDVLWMDKHIQDMGRRIILDESPEPYLRSRLWNHDEILDVLQKHKGTREIEGILLPSNQPCLGVCLHGEDFAVMKRLRFLNINGAHYQGEFPPLPSSLIWFSWWGCPLEILPSNFFLKKLVYMNLSNSRIRQAWKNKPQNEFECFRNLKVLHLRFCDLSESPDFSWFPRLETLDLGCCKNMVNLHESIGDLKSLIELYLDDTKIEELPNNICRLGSLQFLSLISCTSLQKLPESIGDLKSLVTLSLDGTKIEELPNSICSLSSLQVLTLISCSLLQKLPESIGDLKSIVRLSLDGTNIEELPNSICKLNSLQFLSLNWCSSLKDLPDSIGNLKSLIQLSIRGTKIKEVPASLGLLEKLENFYFGLEK